MSRSKRWCGNIFKGVELRRPYAGGVEILAIAPDQNLHTSKPKGLGIGGLGRGYGPTSAVVTANEFNYLEVTPHARKTNIAPYPCLRV